MTQTTSITFKHYTCTKYADELYNFYFISTSSDCRYTEIIYSYTTGTVHRKTMVLSQDVAIQKMMNFNKNVPLYYTLKLRLNGKNY